MTPEYCSAEGGEGGGGGGGGAWGQGGGVRDTHLKRRQHGCDHFLSIPLKLEYGIKCASIYWDPTAREAAAASESVTILHCRKRMRRRVL